MIKNKKSVRGHHYEPQINAPIIELARKLIAEQFRLELKNKISTKWLILPGFGLLIPTVIIHYIFRIMGAFEKFWKILPPAQKNM